MDGAEQTGLPLDADQPPLDYRPLELSLRRVGERFKNTKSWNSLFMAFHLDRRSIVQLRLAARSGSSLKAAQSPVFAPFVHQLRFFARMFTRVLVFQCEHLSVGGTAMLQAIYCQWETAIARQVQRL